MVPSTPPTPYASDSEWSSICVRHLQSLGSFNEQTAQTEQRQMGGFTMLDRRWVGDNAMVTIAVGLWTPGWCKTDYYSGSIPLITTQTSLLSFRSLWRLSWWEQHFSVLLSWRHSAMMGGMDCLYVNIKGMSCAGRKISHANLGLLLKESLTLSSHCLEGKYVPTHHLPIEIVNKTNELVYPVSACH